MVELVRGDFFFSYTEYYGTLKLFSCSLKNKFEKVENSACMKVYYDNLQPSTKENEKYFNSYQY